MGKNLCLTYWLHSFYHICAASRLNEQNGMCAQRRQINLGIRLVCSESSLSTWGKLRSLAIIRAHSQASDQAERMPRPIGVFAGRKGYFVGFVMRRLVLLCLTCINNTDFCYFEAFYFLKLPEKARDFMYPCTCMFISVYYVILQTSSNTHLYLSRRSTRLTVHIAF